MLQRLRSALLQRTRRAPRAGSNDAAQAGTSAPRDYEAERDEARHAHMSTEDQAWETASRQREQDTHAPGAAPDDLAPPPGRQNH